MARWRNRLSQLALPDATDILTTNSSAQGGQAFTAMVKTGGGTVRFVDARDVVAFADVAGGGVAQGNVTGLWNTMVGVVEVRGYGNLAAGAIPGGDSRIIQLQSSTDVCRLEVGASNKSLYLYPETGSSAAWSSGVSLPAAAYWRAMMGFDVTNGYLRAALYLANGGDTTTAAWDTGVLTGQAMGSLACTGLYLGQINTAAGGTLEVDYWQFDDSTMAPLGYWTPAPTASGTPVEYVEIDLSSIPSGGSGAPFAIVSATQTAGTTVTGLSHSGTGLTFKFHKDSLVDTATFSVIFEDSVGTDAQAFSVIVTPPSSSPAFAGPYQLNDAGIWVP